MLLKVGLPIAAITLAAKKYASRNGDGSDPSDATAL